MYLFNNTACQRSFLKCIYLIASILLQINSSYFSKMFLVGFYYEPVHLDVKEVYFEEEQDILNTCQKSRKVNALLNVVDVENEA